MEKTLVLEQCSVKRKERGTFVMMSAEETDTEKRWSKREQEMEN